MLKCRGIGMFHNDRENMGNYAIEIIQTELDEMKSNIEWVENPESVRYYVDDDEEDLKRWKRQVQELENALKTLQLETKNV